MNLDPISTGFPDLDVLTGGLTRKQLVTFAGQSASGLSTALLSIVAHVAVDLGERTLLVDLESSGRIVAERLVSAVSGVTRDKVRDRSAATTQELTKIEDAETRVHEAHLDVQTHLPTVDAIKLHALDFPPRLIVIDGTRLLDFDGGTKVSEQLERLAVKLKTLATSLDTTVCISQPVARSIGGQSDEDLHPLNVNSDQVVMVRTYQTFGPDTETELDVVKNRMGPLGSVHVLPQFDRSRFLSMAESAR